MGYIKTINMVIRKYRLYEKRVLDVGCGQGYWLSKFGKGSIGLDVNENNIRKAAEKGLNVIQADVEHGLDKIPNKYFDAIFCSDILEHLTAPFNTLTNLRQKLKNKGLLIVRAVTIPHNRVIRKFFNRFSPGYGSITHHYIFTKETVEFLIERSGYRILETLPPIYVSYPLSRLAWMLLGKSNFPNIVIVAEKNEYAYEKAVMGRIANTIGKKRLDEKTKTIIKEMIKRDYPLEEIITKIKQEYGGG